MTLTFNMSIFYLCGYIFYLRPIKNRISDKNLKSYIWFFAPVSALRCKGSQKLGFFTAVLKKYEKLYIGKCNGILERLPLTSNFIGDHYKKGSLFQNGNCADYMS